MIDIDRLMSQNIQGFQDVQQRLQHQNNLDMLQGTGSMPQQYMQQQQQHHQQQQHQQHQQSHLQQHQQQQNHQQQQQQNHQQQQNQQQQQNHQSSPTFPGPGLTPAMLLPNQPFGMLPQGGSAGNGSNSNGQGNSNQGNFDVNSELKRLQRLQQQLGGQGQNALLFPDSNNQMNQPPSMNNQAALLQQMLDQQKLQSNNLMGNSNCFNPIFAQPGLLQDARLLLAQSQFGGMAQGGQNNGTDMPLPSPHSLFHRDGSRRMRGGVIEPFPEKLHRLLTEVEAAGRSDVISFVANGRAFAIHKPDKFFKEIVPLYFRQSRLSSFKRQLNLYGFELINTGPSRGGYFHELFVKDRPDLCRRMRRVAVKVSASKGDKDEGDHSGRGKKQGGQDSTGAGDDGDMIGLPTNADLLHHHGGSL